MLTTDETVGRAEWIIDDTCLVFISNSSLSPRPISNQVGVHFHIFLISLFQDNYSWFYKIRSAAFVQVRIRYFKQNVYRFYTENLLTVNYWKSFLSNISW